MGTRDADRADRPAVCSDNRGAHARAEGLVLAVIGGVAAALCQPDLLPERGEVTDRPLGPGTEVHPCVDPFALLVRHRGKHGLAQRGGVERHRLADPGDQLDAVLGFQLVDVHDMHVIDHAEVNGLPELIAERREVRASDAPEIQTGRDTVGQPQDLAAQPVAPGRLVLGDIAGLDEGPEKTRHGGLVEARALADCRRAEPIAVPARQRLQNIETATQGPSHRCFTW